MTSKVDDEALANDPDAQLELIQKTYATGDAYAIDQAIAEVSWARRMKKQGLLDFSAKPRDSERDD